MIPYEEIWTVYEREGPVVLGLLAGKRLVLPESWIPEPGLAGAVVEELRARIGRLPEGEAILARIEENRER